MINIEGIEIEEKKENVEIIAGAGEKIGKLARVFLKRDISGFEELSGIPGTLGGAVRMNAGAHGKEMKDIIKGVKCIDYNGKEKILTTEEMQFDYRKSMLVNNKYIVTKVKIELQKGKEEEIKEKIAVMEVRLFEGMSKYGKAYKDYGISRYVIPYSTFYSQTNTGFFCTPEIGDTVDIHFLNREEKFVRASWSVNNKGNVFDISTTKSYSTYSPSINTQCDNSIVRSTKNLLIASDDYMGIESIGDMSIYGKRLEVIGKEEEVVIEASKEIRLKGEKIHNN